MRGFARGELQLGILIEQMRREDYEFCVSPPKIVTDENNMEPYLEVIVDVDSEYSGTVINGLTDNSHPCQALADMLTIYETFGKLKGLKVVYLGDDNNVSSSLAEVCSKTQMECVISSPTIIQRKNPVMRFEKDPQKAVEQADVIYTDTWVSMGDTGSKEKIQSLQAYQLNRELLSNAKANTRTPKP